MCYLRFVWSNKSTLVFSSVEPVNLLVVCIVSNIIGQILNLFIFWVRYEFEHVIYRILHSKQLKSLIWYAYFDIIFLPLQKEIALYTASKINREFCWFDIDGDIDPLFKVTYCLS